MGVAERRERERHARKVAVLDAARSVLLEKGYRNTTTREIASRCELSEATLFFYFTNKDEIVLSLLYESIEFWANGLKKLAASRLAPEKRLDQIWQLHEKVQEEHPEYYVISAYLAQSNALQGVSSEIREEIATLSGRNFSRLSHLLEEITGLEDGRHLADTLWATFLGLMVLKQSRNNLNHEEVRSGVQDRAASLSILKRGLLSAIETGKRS
ncbi:MAG: helix-turn-helix domain-containing protein [Pseudomonadales bacterium]|nr:TetR/AcrR family transcriptional regulator [Pseudomonadales bacterium]